MEIRPIAPADDLEELYDLRARAFGTHPFPALAARFAERAIAEGRLFGCYEGGRLVASARFHDMVQWWYGRAVPMAGVAGVYVAPESRGRGVGGRLMSVLLERIAGRGYPLSVLYPATAPVYRKVGYEHAGAQHVITLPAEALRTLSPGAVTPRRAGPADAAEVTAALARAYEGTRDCGPIGWPLEDVRTGLDDRETFAYLADDGYLDYGWSAGNSELYVRHLVAGSEATARTLAAVVGSGSSVARTVRACLSPHDPLLWLIRDRSADDLRRVSWMLRLVDAPAAIAARGFPPAVRAGATLVVTDRQCPHNAGRWRLTVAGGHGSLERTDTTDDTAAGTGGAVLLSARGLAALYAGVPMGTLRRAGLAEGGSTGDPSEGGDAALDAAFAAAPYMLDYF